MSFQVRISKGILVQQAPQVTQGRLCSILDATERKVQVGASQGCIPGTRMVCQDRRQELVALSEPLIVRQELPNAFLGLILDTDSDSRPGPIEGFILQALQDPLVDVAYIGSCSQSVQGRDQDPVGVELLSMMLIQGLFVQGLFHFLRKFHELTMVHSRSIWHRSLEFLRSSHAEEAGGRREDAEELTWPLHRAKTSAIEKGPDKNA